MSEKDSFTVSDVAKASISPPVGKGPHMGFGPKVIDMKRKAPETPQKTEYGAIISATDENAEEMVKLVVEMRKLNKDTKPTMIVIGGK